MENVLQNLPQSLIVGLVVIVVSGVLLIPIVLRLAGLTGAQIVDVLTSTMKFALDLIAEFRTENKRPDA